MSAEKLEVFVTKYALTKGVEAVVVERSKPDDTMVSHGWTYYHSGDWHIDRAAAVAKAEQMRQRKVASLKKQLTKLEATLFG